MPQLGLGLGLHKGSLGLTPLSLLKKYTSAMWLPLKATGISPGINSPFTNPMIDLDGFAPLTLNNFAGTSASGYVETVCKNIGQDGSYTNLVTNGDFSQGTTGWSFGNTTSSVKDNEITGVGDGTASTPNLIGGNSGQTFASGVRLNLSCEVSVPIGCTDVRLVLRDTTSGHALIAQSITPSVFNTYTKLNGNIALPSSSQFPRMQVVFTFPNATTSNGKEMKVKQVQLINLTDNPLVQYLESRLDRQLTVAECDYLFTFTPTTATLKATTVPFLKFDGINDFGSADHPNLDIVGTGDFVIMCVIKIPTQKFQYLYSVHNPILQQFPLFGLQIYDNGIMVFHNGTATPSIIGSVQTSLSKLLIYKKNGRLKARLGNSEIYNQENTFNLTTNPIKTVGVRTNDAIGTTFTDYTNIALGHLSITNGAVTPLPSEADLIKAWDNYCLKTFGL